MPLTTTTFAAIRDNQITKIEALTPTLLSEHLFRRSPKNRRLVDWAVSAGSAALRRFEIVRAGEAVDAQVMDPTAFERNEEGLLLVAYPVQVALYGAADLDDLETVMRSDAKQLRDTLFSAGNYLAGQSACFVDPIPEPDRSDDRVWFQPLPFLLIYTEAQSLV